MAETSEYLSVFITSHNMAKREKQPKLDSRARDFDQLVLFEISGQPVCFFCYSASSK